MTVTHAQFASMPPAALLVSGPDASKVGRLEWRCLYCHAPKQNELTWCKKCGCSGFVSVFEQVPWWRRRAVLRRRLAHKLVAALKANT